MSTDDDTPRAAPGQVVRTLGRLHGRPGRVVAQFVATGTVAGLLEALALVLFTGGALQVTGNVTPTEFGPISLETSASNMLLAAAVAIICAAGLHVVQARLSADASLQILENARRAVATSFLRADWTTQAEARDGALHDAMFHLCGRASTAASFGAGAFNGSIIMVSLIASAFLVAPAFSAVLIVAVIPIAAILRPLSKRARRHTSENVRQTVGLSEQVAATHAMAFEFQAFGVSEAQLEQLDELNRTTVRAMRGARFATRLAAFWFKDLALLLFIAVLGVIDLLWDLTQPAAAAAILLVIRALGYAQQGYNAYQNVVESGPAILELDRRTQEMTEAVQSREGRPIDRIGSLEFDDVSYSYPTGRLALDRVSFTIPEGRVLGIVGRSGAGKSTVAELLLRMRPPTSGRILADGVDASLLSLDDWRRLVAVVPQDPRVLRTSIADNITFLREGYSRDDVERAARASHLDVDIDQFHDGYDTVLGANNRGLSGGQRQRLAIARALISRPTLLILDEPTSALDRHSEQRLQKTLEELRGELSMVVIAHRLSTLDLCDDLLVLDRGRRVAHGTREEMMATQDFFTSLPEHEAHDVGARPEATSTPAPDASPQL